MREGDEMGFCKSEHLYGCPDKSWTAIQVDIDNDSSPVIDFRQPVWKTTVFLKVSDRGTLQQFFQVRSYESKMRLALSRVLH